MNKIKLSEYLFKMNSTMPNVTVFEAVYEWNASKVLEILASLINMAFITPMMFYVIWYERFGAGHQKTLVNQMVASGFLYGLTFNIISQIFDIVILAFGPFSPFICHVRRFIKGALLVQIVVITTAVSVVKYVFIFVFKSPPDCNDDVWCQCYKTFLRP